MKYELSVQQTAQMIKFAAKRIVGNEPMLTLIDQKLGDGDHGTGMKRGFSSVVNANLECNTINEVFRETGMALLKAMGGASGVLFSTFFIGGIKYCQEVTSLSTPFAAEFFSHSYRAVKERGRGVEGKKTMLDSMGPAVRKLEECVEYPICEALSFAASSARAGMEATKNMIAGFGRAKQFGESGIGLQDAGATSVYILFDGMADYCAGVVS